MKKYEELFYKAVIIVVTLATFLLAIYEIRKKGTITGLTLLPFLVLVIPYTCEELVKMIKSLWNQVEEEENENE